jgi:SOS response regulatory protein OraA/RecX
MKKSTNNTEVAVLVEASEATVVKKEKIVVTQEMIDQISSMEFTEADSGRSKKTAPDLKSKSNLIYILLQKGFSPSGIRNALVEKGYKTTHPSEVKRVKDAYLTPAAAPEVAVETAE